jgi:hypothetical protein
MGLQDTNISGEAPEQGQWQLLGVGRKCMREAVPKQISPLCANLQSDHKVVTNPDEHWWRLVFVDGEVGCVQTVNQTRPID